MDEIIDIVKMLARQRASEENDFHIIVTGPEGSGKSLTALRLSTAIDDTFLPNLSERLLLSEKDLEKFPTQLAERLTAIEQNNVEKGHLEVFQIDETQNIAQNRNAMTRINKKLIELIMTMRVCKAGIVYCTPDIMSIERQILRRAAMLVICQRSRFYVYFNTISVGNVTYQGSMQRLVARLYKYRQKSGYTPDLVPGTLQRLYVYPDAVGYISLDTGLKSIYDNIKSTKTKEFLNNLLSNENKEETPKEKPKKRIFNNINIGFSDTGCGQKYDYIQDTVNAMDYYSYQAIESLGINARTFGRYAQKLGIPKLKNKKRIYFLGDDIRKVLNLEL